MIASAISFLLNGTEKPAKLLIRIEVIQETNISAVIWGHTYGDLVSILDSRLVC